MQQSITPAELAEAVHTDQKKVRKFLREVTPKKEQPGRGNRWTLPGGKRNLTRLQKQYDEWSKMHTRQTGTA